MIPLHTEVIYLAVGIPSLIFYVIVIISLLQRSRKEGTAVAFYRIFAVVCILDCTSYIVNTTNFRLPMCPALSFLYVHFKPSAITVILNVAQYFCWFAQLFGQCLITLNRFTAVAFPARHIMLWQKYSFRAICGMLLFGFACSWQLLLTTVHFERHEIAGTEQFYYTFYTDDADILIANNPLYYTTILVSIMSVIASLFQITLHTLIFLLIRRRRTNQETSPHQLPKTELNLLLLSLAMFLISLTYGIYQAR
ncbi:hypothetical protein QR680_007915 [Steinernema hermaphroditum]|uniref:Serpentine receptor class gamma n=1 Tax=Steinernema hermaphroditum TaxID=289476 RepID=A0AA39IG88_9BILA|nr:hypothetical protein QR680_007915 [Steinernema hermaphroditum]